VGERLALVKRKLATTLVLVAALVMSTFSVFSSTRPAQAASNSPNALWPIDGLAPNPATDNAILTWDEELLQAIRLHPGTTGPTVASRALAVLHTATYDAWAAYDATAVPTLANGNPEMTVTDPLAREAQKKEAISYAAFRVLQNLFPQSPRYPFIEQPNPTTGKMADFKGQMTYYGFATDGSTPTTAAQIGARAADAVIADRANDGANQGGNYADTTGYQPTRQYNQATDPWRWQPLCVLTAAGVQANATYPPPPGTDCIPSETQTHYTIQRPLHPHWKNVRSFALNAPNQFMPPGPPRLANGEYDPKDIETALADTSNLTDAKKMTAEYWSDGPGSEFPPGHWAVIAQALSRKRGHSIDTDAKMFFTLGHAVLDAGISAWSAKFTLDNPKTTDKVDPWDFWRPITAIRHHYRGKMINSWKGPGKGYTLVPAEQWLPYQALNVVTPNFPEYTSGHSTFSGAARVAILAFTGSDYFAAKVTIRKGTSLIEPNITPAKDVVLSWRDMLDASEQAGMSRRYGGIHFYSGDKHGRANGASVGYFVYDKARKYFNGTATPVAPAS
jgi:hypothetical protein